MSTVISPPLEGSRGESPPPRTAEQRQQALPLAPARRGWRETRAREAERSRTR
jgi:hypothetical protein